MRVLVTGATGLLGTWLTRTSPESVDLVAAWHRRPVADGIVAVRADLLDAREVRRMMASVRPDVVVHTAYARDHDGVVGITRHVATAAEAVGAHVVHLSSDALFRGDGRCHHEDAVPEPIHDYGRAKAAAEADVIAKQNDHFHFKRTVAPDWEEPVMWRTAGPSTKKLEDMLEARLQAELARNAPAADDVRARKKEETRRRERKAKKKQQMKRRRRANNVKRP